MSNRSSISDNGILPSIQSQPGAKTPTYHNISVEEALEKSKKGVSTGKLIEAAVAVRNAVPDSEKPGLTKVRDVIVAGDTNRDGFVSKHEFASSPELRAACSALEKSIRSLGPAALPQLQPFAPKNEPSPSYMNR